MIKNVFIFLVLAFVFVLSGCATRKTLNDLTNASDVQKEAFVVDMNYQKVFRIVSEKARKCFQESVYGNARRTEENLDTKKQIGEVKIINSNAFRGDDYWGYYVFKAQGDKKTEITTYLPSSELIANNYKSKKIKMWLNGEDKCWVVDPKDVQN